MTYYTIVKYYWGINRGVFSFETKEKFDCVLASYLSILIYNSYLSLNKNLNQISTYQQELIGFPQLLLDVIRSSGGATASTTPFWT